MQFPASSRNNAEENNNNSCGITTDKWKDVDNANETNAKSIAHTLLFVHIPQLSHQRMSRS